MFFDEFSKPAIFVIFGHFRKAFSPIFLGVQRHVIAQKKGTVLFFKKPIADWLGLAVFLETVFRGTIFFFRKSKFSSSNVHNFIINDVF
jgi:hypothetical protein